jgi:HD-GYP domain-containing protein (c-di-GMP phosphodiesterase class II)
MGIKKVRIFEALPGMILAKPVVVLNAQGRELMRPGFMLEKAHIKRLGQWGIEYIYVESVEVDEEENALFNESIRFLAKQTYEDAITSLARVSKNLLAEDSCDITDVTQTISQILEVIALEYGMLSLLSKLKESDEYLYQHNVDVCVTGLILGRELNLSESELHDLGTACLLHDVGLSAYKQQKWDNSMLSREPVNIRKHPVRSCDMARTVRGINAAALTIIAQHHEYIDGSGFPEGLKEDQIHPLAKICAVAEAYNTLIAPSDKENRVDPHEAMTMIVDPRYKRFDPAVLRVFINNMAIYPAGTFVQLNNSMRAVVIAGNKNHPLRPRILVLYENESTAVKPFHVDLCDSSYNDWYIACVVSSTNIIKTVEHLMKI